MSWAKRITLGAVAGCLTIGLVACPTAVVTVFIPDAGLEMAVRSTIGKPLGMLTKVDMLRLRQLDARQRNIENLAGLELSRNLSWLDLDTNNVSDLKPLASLINIQYLNLDSNQVTDLTPLAGLVNMDGLSLFDNQIGDIQPLVTNAANGGLGPGDYVILDAETLGERAVNIDIPILRDDFGVNVILAVPQGD